MATLDIIILVVFGCSLIYGFWRGLTVQFGSLLGLLLGILACRLFGDWGSSVVYSWMPHTSDSPAVAHYVSSVIANVILFLAGYFLTRAVASAVKAVVDALFMGGIDRILGALFAAFMWLLVLSIVLNVWQMFSSGSVIAGCRLAHGLAAKAVLDLAPAVFGFAAMD